MLIIYAETGRIKDANHSACLYYGYSRNKFKRMHIQEINAFSEGLVFQEMENAKLEKRNYFNFKHRLKSGELREVEVVRDTNS